MERRRSLGSGSVPGSGDGEHYRWRGSTGPRPPELPWRPRSRCGPLSATSGGAERSWGAVWRKGVKLTDGARLLAADRAVLPIGAV